MGQVVAVDFGGPDPLLSKRQIARHPEVRRSPRWIEQRVGEGMPSQLIDGKRMFQLGEVIDWLAERGRTRRATPTEPDAALVERLERWRESAADGGPPSTVLKYEALKRIAATQPQSIAALRAVKGVGPSFLARHGASSRRAARYRGRSRAGAFCALGAAGQLGLARRRGNRRRVRRPATRGVSIQARAAFSEAAAPVSPAIFRCQASPPAQPLDFWARPPTRCAAGSAGTAFPSRLGRRVGNGGTTWRPSKHFATP